MRPGGHSVALIHNALANLGGMLRDDPSTRARISAAAGAVVARLLPAAQVEIAGFIGRVVGNWDAATITDKLELRVGKDLQFIRVNGTLVGFLIGGVLFLLLHFGFHQQG
jgi:Predicted membrane protein